MSDLAYIVEVSGEFIVDDEEINSNFVAEDAVREQIDPENEHSLEFEARLVRKTDEEAQEEVTTND